MLLAPHHLGLTAVFSHHHGWTANGYIWKSPRFYLQDFHTRLSLCVSVSASSFLILSRSFLALEGFFLADVKIASTDKNTRLFRGLSSGGSLSCFLRPIWNKHFFSSSSSSSSLVWLGYCPNLAELKNKNIQNKNHRMKPGVSHGSLRLLPHKL